MTSKTETVATTMDTAKLALAAGIFIGGIALYYYFGDMSALLRTLGVLVAAVVALLLASQTGLGRQTTGFLHDAQIEIRKVVWPTTAETRQTTMLVVVMVIVVSLMLWGIDSLLGVLVRGVMNAG